MRKATPFSLIPLFMVAFSISAFAQAERDVKTGGAGREETLKLSINGGWNVAWLHVGSDVIEIATTSSAPFGSARNTISQIIGTAHIDLRASLQDNIDVVVRLARPFSAFGTLESELGTAGAYNTDWNPLGGGSDAIGNSDVNIPEAYLTIREVFDPAVSIQIGQFPVTFDVRGTGDPMFFALGNSESVTESVGDGDGIPNGAARASAYFAGIAVTYNRDKFSLQAGLMQHDEAAGLDVNDQLERVFFAHATFDVTEDGSKVGVIATWTFLDSVFGDDGLDDDVLGLGVSANIHVATDIDVFVEVYMIDGQSDPAAGAATNIEALAFRVGGHINFPGSTPAWAELSVKVLEGGSAADIASGDYNGFVSYENDDDMLFFDSNEYGIDLDQNVFMIKVKGGVSLSTGGGTNNLNLIGKLAILEADEDADLPGDNAWGNEFDATVEYMFNKNAKVYFTIAFVFGADAFTSTTNPLLTGVSAEDSGLMFMLGTSGSW